jgi:hypothetical protein
MKEYARPIDVTTSPDLRRIVEQLQRSRQPIPITQDSEIVAVVQPVAQAKRRTVKLPSETAIATARSAFGALKGILDDRKMKEIYRARGSNCSSPPPPFTTTSRS